MVWCWFRIEASIPEEKEGSIRTEEMLDLHGDVPKGTEPSRIQPQAHQERVTLHLQIDVAPEFSAKKLLESHSSGEVMLPWIAFREAAAVPGLDSEVERRASARYREPEKSTSK